MGSFQLVKGDKVTLQHRKGEWAAVTKITNSTSPTLLRFDVEFPDGEVETGLVLPYIDEHEPAKSL